MSGYRVADMGHETPCHIWTGPLTWARVGDQDKEGRDGREA